MDPGAKSEICLDSVITMLESTGVSPKKHGAIRLETMISMILITIPGCIPDFHPTLKL